MPDTIPKAPPLAPLPTLPYRATKESIKDNMKEKGISDTVLKQLADEGFPPSMVLSFLYTAAYNNTVVSSRTPGGVGTELIEQGYDLKGFQIKCKSCNWGPMAGFLCQLPFLNKEGYEKVGYNTGYIVAYLRSLNSFNEGEKWKMASFDNLVQELGTLQATSLDELLPKVRELRLKVFPPPSVGRLRSHYSIKPFLPAKLAAAPIMDEANVRAIYNSFPQAQNTPSELVRKTIAELQKQFSVPANEAAVTAIKAYREDEKQAGEWSGENQIPADCLTPFLQIKRKYITNPGEPGGEDLMDSGKQAKNDAALLTKLKLTKGISGDVCFAPNSKGEANRRIIGTAYNAIEPGQTKDLDKSDSSIKLEFLLERDAEDRDAWDIYGGATYYRKVTNQKAVEKENAKKIWTTWTPYDFKERKVGPELLEELGIKPNKLKKKKKAGAADETDAELLVRQEANNKEFNECMNLMLDTGRKSANSDAITHLNETYYPLNGIMNPHPPYAVTSAEFYKNAVSGDFDLFAFWPAFNQPLWKVNRLSENTLEQSLKLAVNVDGLFYIDFIPGFDEIVQLQENPERGNISYLGEKVGGTLNSLAHRLTRAAVAANKAFHSDEGGRPGIMEIEFPVAVFLPDKIKTATLGVAVADGTAGGLIKTNADFVQLLLDINYEVGAAGQASHKKKNYAIIIHSEWMMHLFFIALVGTESDFNPETWFRKQTWFKEVKTRDSTGKDIPEGQDLTDREKQVTNKIKEFIKIKKAHDEVEAKAWDKFDGKQFVDNLKWLLRGRIGKDGTLQQMSDVTFTALQSKLLELAFFGDSKAMWRKMEVMQVLYAQELAA